MMTFSTKNHNKNVSSLTIFNRINFKDTADDDDDDKLINSIMKFKANKSYQWISKVKIFKTTEGKEEKSFFFV